MRVLFDIVHPADVHFFRHSVDRLVADGNEVMLTSREKDIVTQLLGELSLPNRVLSTQGNGPAGLFAELVRRDTKMLKLVRRFKPHVLVGNNSPSVAHVGFMLRRPSIIFDDTEINNYVRALYRGFVTEIHTPRCYRLDLGPKQVRYTGYHALAYLHPDHFQVEPALISSYGLRADEPYFLFRFVRWGASHDLGVDGLTDAKKEELVDLASRYGRVVISAEDELPDSLKGYAVPIRFADMHQVVAGAAGVIGESATMCLEAACLGCPSLLIDEFGRGYTDELEEEFALVQRLPAVHWNDVLTAADWIFQRRFSGLKIAESHRRLLAETVNVAEYQLSQIKRLAGAGGA